MPELSCTVQTCVHNYQYLCELDKIQVGGNSAKDAQETCCDSFEERREGSYSNKTAVTPATAVGQNVQHLIVAVIEH